MNQERKARYKEKVDYAKSIAELNEYFYFFRKLWSDQSVNWIAKEAL